MSDRPAHPVDGLRAERAAVVDRLATMEADLRALFDASADSNADDEHDPEGQTIAFERSQLTSLIQRAEQHLSEIDEALRRVEARTWGRCEVCGEEIPPARLAARPTARACVEHAASLRP